MHFNAPLVFFENISKMASYRELGFVGVFIHSAIPAATDCERGHAHYKFVEEGRTNMSAELLDSSVRVRAYLWDTKTEGQEFTKKYDFHPTTSIGFKYFKDGASADVKEVKSFIAAHRAIESSSTTSSSSSSTDAVQPQPVPLHEEEMATAAGTADVNNDSNIRQSNRRVKLPSRFEHFVL